MKYKRNASLSTLVDDVTEAIADYARWPHVEARRETVEREIAVLREALHGFDPVIPNAIMMKIAADFFSETANRDIPNDGLQLALHQIANLRSAPKPRPSTTSQEKAP